VLTTLLLVSFAVVLNLNTTQPPMYTTALASRQSSTQFRRSPLRIPRPSGVDLTISVQLASDVGGRSTTINVASVQPNAAIDAARFAQSAPAAVNLATV